MKILDKYARGGTTPNYDKGGYTLTESDIAALYQMPFIWKGVDGKEDSKDGLWDKYLTSSSGNKWSVRDIIGRVGRPNSNVTLVTHNGKKAIKYRNRVFYIPEDTKLHEYLKPNMGQEHENRIAEAKKRENLAKEEVVTVGPITGGKVVEEPISIEPKKVTTVGDLSKTPELPKRPPVQERVMDKPSTEVIEDSEISDDGIVNEKNPKPTPTPEQREEYVPQSQREMKEYVPQSKKYDDGGTVDDINEANRKPKKEGNYRGGSEIPQVVRDKNIVYDRNWNWGDGDSDVDGDGEDTNTTSDTQTTPKKTKDERFDDRQARKQKRNEDRIERKRKRVARRKYRKEMRQYNRTMRRKAREERRAARGHDHVEGRRISPRRWWKNLKGKLTGRWYGEGRAKDYREFRNARTTKPVREYKEGGVSGGNLSKSNKEINEFLKQNKAAKEMKEFRKMNEARKFDWEKIKQPKTATKKLTKSQIAKILAKKGGKALLRKLGYVGAALTVYDASKKVAPATKPALKKRAKSGNYNMGRKI